jgi:RNA polymerase sigma-70 factor (ECF subfamily)
MNTAIRIPNTRIDSTTSDDALVAAIAAGDRAAVTVLFARHAAALRSAARAVVGSHDETIADDAVSDVFVFLLEGRGATFQPARGRALAWLKGIATSTALDHLRARTSRRRKRPKKKSEGDAS